MKSKFESMMTKELRRIIKDNNVDWVEWRLQESMIDDKLEDGESKVYLPLCRVWVAYK